MTTEYFSIVVNAGSVEELEKRIKDNESRGFFVARRFEKSLQGKTFDSARKRSARGKFKCTGYEMTSTFGVVMRKRNEKQEGSE